MDMRLIAHHLIFELVNLKAGKLLRHKVITEEQKRKTKHNSGRKIFIAIGKV